MDVCIYQNAAYIEPEWAGLTQSVCETAGGVWQTNALDVLFQKYFAFDASLFEIVIGGSIVAYIVGHTTGAVIELMRRT